MIRTLPLALLFAVLFSASAALAQTKDTMTVKVFFHNEKLNPNQQDCSKVFPAERTIPRTKAPARAALEEFLKGTREEEQANEFSSFPAEDTRDIVLGLNVKNGVAYVNFKKIVFDKLGNTTSSCGGGFYPGIEATLKQFKTIREVVFAVEGSSDDFYEWVQVGECPHGKHCDKRNFTADR